VTRILTWLALGGGALVVLSLLAFWVAVRPPRLAIGVSPRDVGLAVEDVTIEAPDGVRLAGWLASRPGAPAVILLHGYPAEKADLLPLAAALHRRFTVLLLDFRYFGASGGAATTLGHRERRDVGRAVEWLGRRDLGPIGIFGFSLGGAVALLTAADEPRVRAVVAYAPFADLRVLGREAYRHTWLLRYPLVALMRLWSRLAFGADITRPSPEQAARQLTIPVLIVHGRDDDQVPVGHAERLRVALAANPRAIVEVTGPGRHGAVDERFDQRVSDFFAVALGGPR
jgi:dipeptidyl aminopeptidase/acylaminoacyl peptidase